MGNKRIVILLAILMTLCLCLGIAGFLNRDYKPVEVEPEISNKIKKLDVSEGTTEVVNLNAIVLHYEFTKANTEYNDEGIKLEITEAGIIVKVSNDFLNVENTVDERGNVIDSATFTITDVKDVKAAQANISELEGNRVNVYMLDESNHFYQAVFYAGPDKNHDVAIYKYNISNVESFAVMNAPLNDVVNGELRYVFVRTSDDKYYTDYPFDETFTIRQIVNFEEPKVEPQEEPTEEFQNVEETQENNTETTE